MIYLDNAATTKLKPEVLSAMYPYLTDKYFNASSIYGGGEECFEAIQQSRKDVAKLINANPDRIFFTSGGSESNNTVLKGLASIQHDKKHIITTKIEHPSILNTCKFLENFGYHITYLDVDKYGFVNPEDVLMAITDDTFLISVMFANNEIGSIQNIKEIGRIAHLKDVYMHTDAVQAFAHIPIDVEDMNIDFLSASAHKFNGPKGVGILYARYDINPLIHGGEQESGFRAGTYNTAGIVGAGKAASLYRNEQYIKSIRDYMIDILTNDEVGGILNGSLENRLFNNVNICFPGIDSAELLMLLDRYDIYASAGSACSSSNNEPSHVLLAIGLSEEEAQSSIRFTLSEDISSKEIYEVCEIIKECLNILRGRK